MNILPMMKRERQYTGFTVVPRQSRNAVIIFRDLGWRNCGGEIQAGTSPLDLSKSEGVHGVPLFGDTVEGK
jgi:hypothetical protein